MTRISKIFLAITVVLLLIWQLPWCYAYFFTKPSSSSFVMYSSLLKDFIVNGYGGKKALLKDTQGNTYTQEQGDSLLPAFYMRQLVTDERMPDSLFGEPVNLKAMREAFFSFRVRPSMVNAPQLGLYFLLESMPKRVDLSMPDDAFRFTKQGMEFIHMNDNKVEPEKSKAFTEMLKQKGFSFPPRCVNGEPSTRKEYDNGYLLIDSSYKLFQLKMTRGLPYVKEIKLPVGITPDQVWITEYTDRKSLGFMTDTKHKFYIILTNGEVKETGIPAFDPYTESLMIIGTLYDWTARIDDAEGSRFYGINANDFSLLKSYEIDDPDQHVPGLSFTSPYDQYVRPRF